MGQNQTTQNVMSTYQMDMMNGGNMNTDYLKRVESTGSTGPTLTSAAFLDLQKSKL